MIMLCAPERVKNGTLHAAVMYGSAHARAAVGVDVSSELMLLMHYCRCYCTGYQLTEKK